MTDEANSHFFATIMQMIEGHEFVKNHLSMILKTIFLKNSHFRLQPNKPLVHRSLWIEPNNGLFVKRSQSDSYGYP